MSPAHDAEQPQRPCRLDAVLAEALAVLDQVEHPQGHGLTADRLRAYLHDHVAEPTDLNVVAKHFAISKAHLCRMSRKLLGETLGQSWQRIKMQRACLLLREAGLGVSQVARRVGYGDPFYFSKVFRQTTGLSPRRWRREAQSYGQ